MKAELEVRKGNIRVHIGEDALDDNFYSFELYDSGLIVGGLACEATETTIAAVRERLVALLHPEKKC